MSTIIIIFFFTVIFNIGVHTLWLMSVEKQIKRLKERLTDTRDIWYEDSLRLERKLQALEKKQ